VTPARLARVLSICAALALALLLWRWWTAACNEACPPQRALTMMALSVLLPLAGVLTVFEYTRLPPRPRARGVHAALLGLLLAVAVWVSLGGSSGPR